MPIDTNVEFERSVQQPLMADLFCFSCLVYSGSGRRSDFIFLSFVPCVFWEHPLKEVFMAGVLQALMNSVISIAGWGGMPMLREQVPPFPTQRGTPLPLERQGGGGHALMKPRGSPLPIPFLGEDLNSVTDVNPCRITGGGCPQGHLGWGAPGPGRVVVPDHPCPFLPGGG